MVNGQPGRGRPLQPQIELVLSVRDRSRSDAQDP